MDSNNHPITYHGFLESLRFFEYFFFWISIFDLSRPHTHTPFCIAFILPCTLPMIYLALVLEVSTLLLIQARGVFIIAIVYQSTIIKNTKKRTTTEYEY